MIRVAKAHGHKLFDVLLFVPVTSSGTHKVNVFTIENRNCTHLGWLGEGSRQTLPAGCFPLSRDSYRPTCENEQNNPVINNCRPRNSLFSPCSPQKTVKSLYPERQRFTAICFCVCARWNRCQFGSSSLSLLATLCSVWKSQRESQGCGGSTKRQYGTVPHDEMSSLTSLDGSVISLYATIHCRAVILNVVSCGRYSDCRCVFWHPFPNQSACPFFIILYCSEKYFRRSKGTYKNSGFAGSMHSEVVAPIIAGYVAWEHPKILQLPPSSHFVIGPNFHGSHLIIVTLPFLKIGPKFRDL